MVDLRLEEVARDLLLVVKDNINEALDDVWDQMTAEDPAFYAALGESTPVTPLQYPTRFFMGHHPSILDRPSEDYPNITVVAYNARTIEEGYDQVEVTGNVAYAEAFLLHSDEATLNRMTQRYARALQRVLTSIKELSTSDTEAIEEQPRVSVSNAAARRLDSFVEEIVFVQGCRLEATYRTRDSW